MAISSDKTTTVKVEIFARHLFSPFRAKSSYRENKNTRKYKQQHRVVQQSMYITLIILYYTSLIKSDHYY